MLNVTLPYELLANKNEMTNIKKYILLLVSFVIYSATGIFTKLASLQTFLSWQYALCLCGAVGTLGIYALLWQQIIKRMPVSDAFMWKGTSIVWSLLFAWGLFDEIITWNNVIGAIIIISGITLYAYWNRKECVE